MNLKTRIRKPLEIVAAVKYERKIKKSQKKLAETKLVPGVVQIYA